MQAPLFQQTVAAPETAQRVRRTADLLAARGYAVTPERLGRVALGGCLTPEQVTQAVLAAPGMRLLDGLVVGSAIDVTRSLDRQRGHHAAAPAMWAAATSYSRLLMRHCPWVQVVLVGGSLASDGFEEGDDIDFDLVVSDGTKYLSYLFALALAAPLAWRHRRRAVRAVHDTPLLAKLVCINVVWEEAQAKPFARTDEQLALELLLGRPMVGADELRRILDVNPRLLDHFPQLADLPSNLPAPPPPSAAHRIAAAATRWRPARRALNSLGYAVVRILHAWVRWHRRRNPEARHHAEAMERHKHPYGILQRPGTFQP